MRLLKAFGVAAVLLLPLATLQAKDKKPAKLPAIFNAAQFVYVEAVDGQQLDPRLAPEDAKAISDVFAAFEDWNRYVLATSPDQADLIVVVRKGRLAEADVGVEVGTGPLGAPGRRNGPRYGMGTGAEAGPSDDLFEVYASNPGKPHGMLLWMRKSKDGLDAPGVPLFQEFKAAVERDYPPQQNKP